MTDLFKKRRSIRGFTDQRISDENITQLLEAAVEAPSGGNSQPWHFHVIRDKAIIQKIFDQSLRQKFILSADSMIVVSMDPERSAKNYGDRGRNLYCYQDTAAAVQNILLAATDLGLGSCWCGAFDEAKLSAVLSIPKNLRPVAIIPLGYIADKNGKKADRRPLGDVVTYVG